MPGAASKLKPCRPARTGRGLEIPADLLLMALPPCPDGEGTKSPENRRRGKAEPFPAKLPLCDALSPKEGSLTPLRLLQPP